MKYITNMKVMINFMKVITIKQPFATLISEGLKEYEFRTWKCKYRGDILIHAGKSIDKKAMEKFKDLDLEYPLGCIIAKAKMTDCVLVDKKLKEELSKKDSLVYSGVIADKNQKEYGFKLEEVEKIEPIYINGKLSLWEYPYKK